MARYLTLSELVKHEVPIQNRRKLCYSLYRKNGHRYVRISPQSYTISTARLVFQDRLVEEIKAGRFAAIRAVESY